MLSASLLHLLAGFLFGGLGFRVPVLLVYGLGNVIVATGAIWTAGLTVWEAVGSVALAMVAASIGYLIGAGFAYWRHRAAEQRSDGAHDRLPRLFGFGPWPSIGGSV